MQIQNANSTTTKFMISSLLEVEVVSVFFSKLGFLVKTMCLVLASFQEEVHWMQTWARQNFQEGDRIWCSRGGQNLKNFKRGDRENPKGGLGPFFGDQNFSN